MGKKGRKTRWRTLAIAGESDSEDSSTLTTGFQTPRSYHKPYFSKFPYSSQSTPTRRYQHDAKSTRSSSTASETKITFNEDEYTRITTPRQDVLFKKGYLNKPKNYQTQTSTGNSTTSTGNSTGNGTPDHQSADGAEGTDLEYDAQFVFPNAFVDQNGICYVNSFEPYPLMVYNPPICYPEFQSSRSKRYSTDSMPESTSPHNEAEPNQSGCETAANVQEYNNQQMYNVVYTPQTYYFNGVCAPNNVANSQELRKIKKKRRRKVSKSLTHDGTTSSDDCESSDDEEEEEAVTQVEIESQKISNDDDVTTQDDDVTTQLPEEETDTNDAKEKEQEEAKMCSTEPAPPSQFNLNAEEFVPRAYRHPPTTFVNIHPNFIPIPVLSPLNELPPPPPFLPPGIPLNFLPPVNFYVPKPLPSEKEVEENIKEIKEEEKKDAKKEEKEEESSKIHFKSNIDIAKIVSKLEEAAKEQRLHENKRNGMRYFNKFANNKGQRQRYTKPRGAGDDKAPTIRINAAEKKDEEIQATPSEQQRRLNRYSYQKVAPAPKLPAANYSDTVKKNYACPRFNRQVERSNSYPAAAATKAPPMVSSVEKPRATPQKLTNQWISVSNRKKRKNKSNCEAEDKEELDDSNDAEVKIEDEVDTGTPTVEDATPSQLEIKEEEQQGAEKVSTTPSAMSTISTTPALTTSDTPTSPFIFITSATPTSTASTPANTSTLIATPNCASSATPTSASIDTPSSASIDTPSSARIDTPSSASIGTPTTASIGTPTTASIDTPTSASIDTPTSASSATPSSATSAPSTFTVSAPLAFTINAPPTPKKKSKKGTQKPLIKRIIIVDAPAPEIVQEEQAQTQKQIEQSPAVVEIQEKEKISTPEKKKNKKKKKSSVGKASTPSISDSTTILDDTYDFLLDPSVMEEKTNVEISVELDKMIQKGMYSNLEEKIRSLGAAPVTDDFFKSISFKRPVAENNFNNFGGALLKNSGRILGGEVPTKIDVDFAKISLPDVIEPQPSTSKTGDFLVVEEEEEQKPEVNLNTKSNGKLKNKSKKNASDTPEEEEEGVSKKNLYPITQAVKEWMTKTRENTPEIELLKSPDTIYKEFIKEDPSEDEDEEEVEEEEPKNVIGNPLPVNCHHSEAGERVAGHEIVIFESVDESQKKFHHEKIEEGEDVLESCELKNEDYVKIKADVTETRRLKHGDLPYRAVCCNLM